MSTTPSIHYFETLADLVVKFRNDLTEQHFILLYAYNGMGKTRLSMAFKNRGKEGGEGNRDTLYFNAFTEDLFFWDNDFEGDTNRKLMLNSSSKFFNGFKELALEQKIFPYLERYATFDYRINYDEWYISFNKGIGTNIKISRGEETIFKWCIFLAICELVLDGAEAYQWVKYFYIDDPVSSLDDNNAIAVACDLADLLKQGEGRIKTIISSHHILFYNVISNELKRNSHRKYFLHKDNSDKFSIRKTVDTPFFHHVASLSELKQVVASGNIKSFHFNMLRSIMEKTASFFGYEEFSRCLKDIDDEVLYNRALNLLSHGKYSIYEPVDMGEDNKNLFIQILEAFLNKYEFNLPESFFDSGPLISQGTITTEEAINPAGQTAESSTNISEPVGEQETRNEQAAIPVVETAEQIEQFATEIEEILEQPGEAAIQVDKISEPDDDYQK